jgi:hypothetical protein
VTVATYSLTTSPTMIDDGTSYSVLVTNTGAATVELSRGGRLRPNQAQTVYPEGAALTAAAVTGTSSVSTSTTTKPLPNAADPATLAANAAFTGTYAPIDRTSTALHDEFSRYTDGVLAGKTPTVGPAWLTTGANPTTVTSGKALSSGTGYAYAQLAAAPYALTCEVGFTGGNAAAMTMAWSTSTTFDLFNLLHVNFSPTGFTCTVRQDGGSFDIVLSGAWTKPMLTDGTLYRVTAAVRGERLIVFGPNGDAFASAPDPRIKAQHGRWVFWEPNLSSSTQASIASASALTRATTGTPGSHLDPDVIAGLSVTDGNGRAVGSKGTAWEVAVGLDSVNGAAGVSFVPTTIYTDLSSAVTIGDTTIVTRTPVLGGSTVQLESGTNSETVTTTGSVSGTGPYTVSLTAPATKAHATGTSATATTPSNRRLSMYANATAGTFVLPAAATGVVVPGNFYFTTNVDVLLARSSAGVLGVGGVGAGKGSFKTGQAVTGSRPAAATVGKGAQFYDTTLNKPIPGIFAA